MIAETIQWREVAVEMPDSDETVLGFREEWSDRTWPCFHDGDDWHSAEATTLVEHHPQPEFRPPTHWAPLPAGPTQEGVLA